MSFLRLEDLFVAIVFAVAVAITGWAAIDANDASPLVSADTVVMDRSREYQRPVCRDDANLYLARTF